MLGAISTTAFIFALSGLVTGVTSLVLAAFVLLKNPRNPINRSWALFCTAVSIWGFFGGRVGLAQSTEETLFWMHLAQIGIPMIAPTFYHFTLNFIGAGKRRYRIGLKSTYAIGLAFVLLNFLSPLYLKGAWLVLDSFYWSKGGPLYLLMLVWWGVVVTYAHILLYQSYRVSPENRKNQIRLIFWGTAIGYIGGSTGHLIVLGLPIYPYGNWAIPIYAILTTYAIVKYKALDIQTVVHKTLLWAALSSLVLAPLFGILWLTRPWLESLPTWGVSLFSLGLFYLTTLYYKTIQPQIDHLFQRRKYDLQQVLDRLLERMTVLGEIRELSRQISQTLIETLYAERATLFLWDEKGRRYRPLDESGDHTDLCLPEEDPFIVWIRQRPQVIEADAAAQDPAYAEMKEAAESFFARTKALVCVPLTTGHEFVGLILLGAKSNLKSYNELDLQLLEKLRVEAAIALSNASLYDRVMKLNMELTGLNTQLEERVSERTVELEKANRQLSDSNIKIAEADRAKTQFLANMSHELRTPLNSIIGFSKILIKGIEGPITVKQREDLEAIHHSGAHLLGLISDLLDLSKIEAGKMDLKVAPVQLSEVIQGVMTTAQALIKERGIDLHAEIDSKLPFIEGDAMRLRQVVLNLVSNAIKFTERGEVAVRAERRGAYVVVSVRDTGCGIKPEDQGKLFEEFRQLQGDKGGTGLGLAISKRLVLLHGGEIWVESFPGEGSTFFFSLPVKERASIPI